MENLNETFVKKMATEMNHYLCEDLEKKFGYTSIRLLEREVFHKMRRQAADELDVRMCDKIEWLFDKNLSITKLW